MAPVKVGPLENPLVWLGIQLVEVVLTLAIVGVVVPDSWSAWANVAVVLAVVALLTLANYRFRRRFVPQPPGWPSRGEDGSSRRG